MDDPALAPELHRRALRGLARLNRLSNSVPLVWSALTDLLPTAPTPHSERRTPNALKVLDLATGGGDIPIGLLQRARRHRIPLEVHGCDISDFALQHARSRADLARVPAHFFPLDALSHDLPTGYDVITCSLFTHHLTDDQTVDLLRRMAAAARRRVIVNDLRRSPVTFLGVALASRCLSRSRIVHHDAILSVRAAYTVAEIRCLAHRAGLNDVTVTPHFPARLLLTHTKPRLD
jgi:2-polyprenyl-3-methyl-5-hydroxy-6-metoxy-1,4-benzoquinol methylase